MEFLKSLWWVMNIPWEKKLGWKRRYAQLCFWSVPVLVFSLPGMKLCMLLAELSPIPLVTMFWLMLSLVIGLAGGASSIMLLTSIFVFCWLLAEKIFKLGH